MPVVAVPVAAVLVAFVPDAVVHAAVVLALSTPQMTPVQSGPLQLAVPTSEGLLSNAMNHTTLARLTLPPKRFLVSRNPFERETVLVGDQPMLVGSCIERTEVAVEELTKGDVEELTLVSAHMSTRVLIDRMAQGLPFEIFLQTCADSDG